MTINKRKKVSRQRGSHTHGWGAKKKHRGAGNRGGRGNAGTGKRADHMKTLHWKERYFGKFGFKYLGPKEKINAINIGDLQENLPSLISQKQIIEEKGIYNIDLNKIGYNKLLGSGVVSKKLKINVKYASDTAAEKIKNAGGEVILTKPKSSENAKHIQAKEKPSQKVEEKKKEELTVQKTK